NPACDKIGEQGCQTVSLIFRRSIFHHHILVLDEAGLIQAFPKCPYVMLRADERSTPQEANYGHSGLLRPRSHWPRCGRTAEQSNELAAPHSITSSAATWRVSGIVSPSALAVLRFIMSSNLVGCMTGKSAGFSPLRIRPVWTPACRQVAR